MEKKLIEDLEKEILELNHELELTKLLDSYPGSIPPEWTSDIERLIKIKERVPKLMKIMSKIKILQFITWMKDKIKAFKKEVYPILLKVIEDKDIIPPSNLDSLIEFIFSEIGGNDVDAIKCTYDDILYYIGWWYRNEKILKFSKASNYQVLRYLKEKRFPKPINFDEFVYYIFGEIDGYNDLLALPKWNYADISKAINKWLIEEFSHYTTKQLTANFGTKKDLIHKFGYLKAAELIRMAKEETETQDMLARDRDEDDRNASENIIGDFDEFWAEEIDPDFGPGEN